MAESPIALLRAHARHAPWNARGLAAHVTALVDAAGVRPTNASARAAPSARSIRFYVANGLLERPEGTGTAATYNYRHFLQLLAIKIRQREGVTLEIIKKEMKEFTGDALERRVATSLAAALGATVETRQAGDRRRSVRELAAHARRRWRRAARPRRFARRRATKRSSRCAKPFAPRSAARISASDVRRLEESRKQRRARSSIFAQIERCSKFLELDLLRVSQIVEKRRVHLARRTPSRAPRDSTRC